MQINPVSNSLPSPVWGEIPPGTPLDLESPWVKFSEELFPQENPVILSRYASYLKTNMERMISAQISRDRKKAHETALKMKDAIEGRY